MKKLPVVLCACLAIAGCTTTFEPDIDKAAARRDANRTAYHQEFGCHFSGDHTSYRECLLNTYAAEKPKTLSLSRDDKGRSVAIVKDETRESYDKSTDTYKTERIIVIETEEQLVPVSPSSETLSGESDLLVSEEDCDVCSEPTEEPAPVVVDKPKPIPVEKKDTWWDTYKKKKTVEGQDVQCPCPDPNTPCPQCIDK